MKTLFTIAAGLCVLSCALPFASNAEEVITDRSIIEADALHGIPLRSARIDDALRAPHVYAAGGDLFEQFIRFIFPLTGRERRTMFMPLPYWGKKKPLYRKYDWHKFESEHFVFLTYTEGEVLLPTVIQYLEQDYEANNRIFGVDHRFTKKIPVLYYQTRRDFEQSTAIAGPVPESLKGLTEIFSWKRVMFPFEGERALLEHVARHEGAHIYQIAKGSRRIPLWFTEGMAETVSVKWDAQADMTIRDAYLNGFFFRLSDLWQIQGSWLMYKEGNFITNLIWDEYGEQGIRRIYDNSGEMSFAKNIEKSLGLEMNELEHKITTALDKRYHHLLERKDILNRAQKVEERKTLLYAHKDFYLSGGLKGPRAALFVNHISRDGKRKKKQIVSDRRFLNESLEFFQKGAWMNDTHIVYSIKRSRRDVIRVVPYTFDQSKRQFSFGKVREFDWEHLPTVSNAVLVDGKKIAFIGYDNGFTNLYLFDMGSNRLTQLTKGDRHISGLDYSPDRKELLFSQEDGPVGALTHYDRNLYTIHVDSLQQTQNYKYVKLKRTFRKVLA